MHTLSWGAHIVCGFAGTTPSDAGVRVLQRRLETGEAAGIILLSYNIESPTQLHALLRHIATFRLPPQHRPLFVMVDQEGGRVQRLTAAKGFRATPSPAEMAAMPEARMREEVAAMARQLAELGINVNLAPCCDVAQHDASLMGRSQRSFGRSPDDVTRCARIVIQEHAKVGVATVLKHFPGLGAARGDTHAGLIDASDDWHDDALVPFRHLSSEFPAVGVMTTHMVNRRLDPSGGPLTFSRDVLCRLLRDEWRSDAVCLTDDLQMGAMQRHFSLEDIIGRSLQAGHDLLLCGENEAALGDGRPPRHVPIPQLAQRVQHIAQALFASIQEAKRAEASHRRVQQWREGMVALGAP